MIPIPPKQTARWKTKDGTKIRVCDMDDQHLHNAIKFIRRQWAASIREANARLASLDDEGCFAPILESQIEEALERGPATLFPIYQNMMLEKRRRKLKFLNPIDNHG